MEFISLMQVIFVDHPPPLGDNRTVNKRYNSYFSVGKINLIPPMTAT